MKLTIKLTLDNAAFADGGIEEVRRIVNEYCDRYRDALGNKLRPSGADGLRLQDINGNHVGTARIL